MRKIILGAALAFVTGCQGPANRCEYGPIEVLSDLPLDCAAVTVAGDTLRRLYERPVIDALGLDPSAGYSFETPWPSPSPVDAWGGFDRAFEGYTVVVDTSLEGLPRCHDKGGCNDHGTTYLSGGSQDFFAHESLHFLECRSGDCHNVDHLGWTDSGWFNFGAAYTVAAPVGSWVSE